MLEDALAPVFFVIGQIHVFKRVPKYDVPLLKSTKITADVICLELAQYRAQEGRWTSIAFLNRASCSVVVKILYSGWGVSDLLGVKILIAGIFCLYPTGNG